MQQTDLSPATPPAGARDRPRPESWDHVVSAEAARRLDELTRGSDFLTLVAVGSALAVVAARHERRDDVVVDTPPRINFAGALPRGRVRIPLTVDWSRTAQAHLQETRRAILHRYASGETQPDGERSAWAVSFRDVTGDLPRGGALEFAWSRRTEGGYAVTIVHDEAVVSAALARRLAHEVDATLAHLLSAPGRTLRELPTLAPAQPPMRVDPRRIGPLHAAFERWVALAPTTPAVVGADDTLSYEDLDEVANRVAHVLIRWGVDVGTPVLLALDGSVNMVVAALGVLKAGGVFVPIDVRYPADRIALMVNDAGAPVVVVDAVTRGRWSGAAARVFDLDADQVLLALARPEAPATHVRGSDLAYVTYTSGSTGRPNGVLTPHAGATNYVAELSALCGITQGTRVSQLFSFSWDGAYVELFKTLSAGGTVYLSRPEERVSSEALADFLADNRIEVVTATPSMVRDLPERNYSALRVLHSAGERCTAEMLRRWTRSSVLINSYGPTEATMSTCSKRCGPELDGPPPLGRPVPNMHAVPLDERGVEPPIGVPGDMHIGGVGLAPGYLDRPWLTAQRFVPAAGDRYYRSGDLIRRLADDDFEFVDRVDDQSKLNGLRIEPGEVEYALRQHPGVSEAAVVVRADEAGRKILVGYVVPRDPAVPPAVVELQRFVDGKVPSHMVPSRFVHLDALPRNANRKIDRRALPDPGQVRPALDTRFVAAETPLERALGDIWREVLSIEEVGRDDSFFDLGGRSLHVTRVMALVVRRLGLEFPPGGFEAFFEHPSIRALAGMLQPVARGGRASIARRPRGDTRHPLSYSQSRLWFMRQLLTEEVASLYNCPAHVRVRGPLRVRPLEDALGGVVARHEIWRTRFPSVDGEPRQDVRPTSEAPVRVGLVDLSGLGAGAAAVLPRLAREHAARPFVLDHGPLHRFDVVRMSSEDHLFLATIDHIVFDGWSMPVLLAELAGAYNRFGEGLPEASEPARVQCADHAAWQREQLGAGAYDAQRAYWRERLIGLQPLVLPTDRTPPATPSFAGAVETLRVDADTALALRELAQRTDATLFMVLLAAFDTLLHRYTDQTDLVISSPAANRDHPATQDLIGFFVNSLVLRVDAGGNPSFVELVSRVRRAVLEALANQDVPFDRLVEELQPARESVRNPMFRAAFSLQNDARQMVAPRGLELAEWATEYRTAKFDLVVALTDVGDGLVGDVEYSTDHFSRERVLELIDAYARLLRELARDPGRVLLDYPLRPEPEPTARAAVGSLRAEHFDLQI